MIDRTGYWSRVRFIEPMECLAVDKLPIVDTRLAAGPLRILPPPNLRRVARIGQTMPDDWSSEAKSEGWFKGPPLRRYGWSSWMAVKPNAQRSVDSLCFLIHQRLWLRNTRRTPNLSQRLAIGGNRELSLPNGLSLYLFHEREAARTGLGGRQC